MGALLTATLVGLDTVRAKLLRIACSFEVLRAVFVNRAQRLFVLYVAFIGIALIVATTVPLWQLLLGPIFYGFAHLLCSVRYFHYAAASNEQFADSQLRSASYRFLVSASIAYGLYRFARSQGLVPGISGRFSEWQGAALVDTVFMCVVFGGAAYLYRKSPPRVVLGAVVLLPVVLCLRTWPLETAGFLALIHNLVGFAYWILLASRPQERRYAFAALGIFLLVNAALFAGSLDPLLDKFARGSHLKFARLDTLELGRMIFPWSNNPNLWLHATVAFAFGQSTHYYVWLKAIPDECHYNRIPTTFKQSYHLLGRDFGRRTSAVIIYGVVAAALVWVFLSFPESRKVYFLVAGFHGFLEIAGLGVARYRRSEFVRTAGAPAPAPRISTRF